MPVDTDAIRRNVPKIADLTDEELIVQFDVSSKLLGAVMDDVRRKVREQTAELLEEKKAA